MPNPNPIYSHIRRGVQDLIFEIDDMLMTTGLDEYAAGFHLSADGSTALVMFLSDAVLNMMVLM